jgi:hypothetical protein
VFLICLLIPRWHRYRFDVMHRRRKSVSGFFSLTSSSFSDECGPEKQNLLTLLSVIRIVKTSTDIYLALFCIRLTMKTIRVARRSTAVRTTHKCSTILPAQNCSPCAPCSSTSRNLSGNFKTVRA